MKLRQKFSSFVILVLSIIFSSVSLIGCGDDSGKDYGSDYTGPGGQNGESGQHPTGSCYLPHEVKVLAGERLDGTLFLSTYADGVDQPRQGKAVPDIGGHGRQLDKFREGDCGPLMVVLATLGPVTFGASEKIEFYEADANMLSVLYRNKYGSNNTPDPRSLSYHEVAQFWFACDQSLVNCDRNMLPDFTFARRQSAMSFSDQYATDPEFRVWVLYYNLNDY